MERPLVSSKTFRGKILYWYICCASDTYKFDFDNFEFGKLISKPGIFGKQGLVD